jgi:thymidine phosphorylase
VAGTALDARAILSQLRAGTQLGPEALNWFAQALGRGEISDAQAGAFAMGICRAPLDSAGRVALTCAMRDSGKTLQWDVPGPVLDKHSTGGVGDCVSLALAPALAACGAYVPMISGRGLGHTGGTLDKLEAIPGYRSEVSLERMQQITAQVGCAIVSASDDLAPADKLLYGVRDVTGTVDSIDLITASILSKKLAEAPEALVLDVKVGSGAIMPDRASAEALARALVQTANGAGCPTTALLTDMSQPLVTAAGNALEVIEVMETLTMTGVTHALWELTVQLGGALLFDSGMTVTREQGGEEISKALSSGRAAEKFGEMVAAMGGPTDFIERWRDRLPGASVQRLVFPEQKGFISQVDTRALGEIVVHLGGGRLRGSDRINPGVGLSQLAGIGEEVGQDRPIAMIHAASQAEADRAEDALVAAYSVGPLPLDPPDLILAQIAGDA